MVLVEVLDAGGRHGRREDVDVAEDYVAHPPAILCTGLGVLRDEPDDDRGESLRSAAVLGIEVLSRGGKDGPGRIGVVFNADVLVNDVVDIRMIAILHI